MRRLCMHDEMEFLTRLVERMAAEMTASLFSIDQRLNALEGTVTGMAMTVADLDNALSAFETAMVANFAEIDEAVNDILAKIGGTTVDLTSEVTRLQAIQTALQTESDKIKGLAGFADITSVTGLSANTGGVAGGGSLVITGVEFNGATAVNFGLVAALSFTIDSDTQITAVIPPGAVGPVDVTVVGLSNTSALVPADVFTYV
jgi:IPT/TIG domain